MMTEDKEEYFCLSKLHIFTVITQSDLLYFRNSYRKFIKGFQTPDRDFKSGRKEEAYCLTCNLNIFHLEVIERQ